MKPKLSIIIVSYNTRNMTIDCLHSVIQERNKTSYEIVLLDNASTDGSAEAVDGEFGSEVVLLPRAENLGFAAGNNYAAKYAKGEYLLLLNPDTVILDNAIDRLMEYAEKFPAAGIWGGRTVFGDGSLNPFSCWGKMTTWSLLAQATGLSSLFKSSNFFNPEGLGGWNREGDREVDIVSGCFLLTRSGLWKKLEGFRESFFMYGEEADFCLRAKSLGARPRVTSKATIVHFGGASEIARADKIVKLLKSKMLLLRYHSPKTTRWLDRELLKFWPISRFAAHTILASFGRLESRKSAETWREVVKRKKDWSVGNKV